jgi:hypothetical protein
MSATRPVDSAPAAGQCACCGHKAHRGRCTRRAHSRCVPLGTDRRPSGFACGARPPCPCPWRTCHCGTPVAIAACAEDAAYEETVERGSAGHPDGTLAVRRLADGTLSARPLAVGSEIATGEWRAIDHDSRCPDSGRRGVVDVTDAAGHRVPPVETSAL